LPSDIQNKTTVPVDFTVGVKGTYTISLNDFSTFDPSVNITLEDMKTKTITDMRTSSYQFTSDAASSETRFALHFSNPTVTGISEQQNSENSVKIYASDNIIYVQNTTNAPAQVMVFDLQGKQVMAKNIGTDNLSKIELNNAEGIYIVKVIADSKTYTQKVTIRRVAMLKITNPDTQVSEDNIDIIDDKMIEENK